MFDTLAFTRPSRTAIGESGAKVLVDGLSAQLLKHRLIPHDGQIDPAILVPAPKQHSQPQGEKARQRVRGAGLLKAGQTTPERRGCDLDTRTWLEQLQKRISINDDVGYKAIWQFETGPARTHHKKHFEAVPGRGNISRDAYADRKGWLREQGYRNQIRIKGRRNKPLSEGKQRPNHRIAKTRVRVEHVFTSIELIEGKLISTIGRAHANFALTMMGACDNLKLLTYFRKTGVEAF